MTRAPFSGIGLLLFAYLSVSSARADDLRDLYFGEALYYAQQGHYFEALQRLDTEVAQHYGLDEPQLDSLWYHINDAEFSLGDFELRYRMHHRAGRAIRAVLEADVDEMVRNDAAYRLARIHFQKNQMADALSALQRIEGRVPQAIRDDIELLRAHVYMSVGRPSEAVAVLEGLSSGEDLRPFVSYNLGIAMLQNGQQQDALQQLSRAGQESVGGDAALAIRDKSNLVLGTILLEAGQYEEAKLYLDRVRLDGPFSTQALLSSGWADVYAENFERAIVPWGILAGREVTDSATQEALLSLPFAYGKLDVHGRAALYYGRALDAFGQEVDKLDASIESIREGKFLEALIREEIRQNKDWVIRLRSLPETPETYYLMELLASHDFQTGLQNYLDLADLKRKLSAWQASFDAYDDMVALRETHYTPLLPDVDREFRKQDSTMRLRLEQHRMLEQRLQAMLTAPRPEFLATGEERQLLARIEALEQRLREMGDADGSDVDQRLRRLRGVLTWSLETEYHERLTSFDRNLRELNAAVELLREQYHQFVRVRQAASHSYEGYATPIMRLRRRVRDAAAKVDLLMGRQGHVIEVVAIEELQNRRQRLETYQDQARFAMADSYDRATQAQARRETE